MKTKLLALAALMASAPAYSTTGLICSTAAPQPLHLSLVIGHTVIPAAVSARLTDDRREIPVILAQSWFDAGEVRVDLVDRNAMRREARLRATWRPATRSFDGSVWRGGKRRWVRCREG